MAFLTVDQSKIGDSTSGSYHSNCLWRVTHGRGASVSLHCNKVRETIHHLFSGASKESVFHSLSGQVLEVASLRCLSSVVNNPIRSIRLFKTMVATHSDHCTIKCGHARLRCLRLIFLSGFAPPSGDQWYGDNFALYVAPSRGCELFSLTRIHIILLC